MRNSILFLLLISSYFFSYAQPANNDCANAILLSNVNNFCSANGAGTIAAATDDGYGAAGCWSTGAINDVWFKFVATATDVTVVINGNQGSPVGGTLNRPQVALYSGTCGGTITELVCASAPTGQNIIQIYKGGLTVGQTYLVRVDGVNGNTGTFKYCINNYNPVPVSGGDCDGVKGAVPLCGLNSFTVQSTSGAGLNNTEMNDATCFGGGTIESNSTWYSMTFSTAGTFNFTITPSNPNDDIDFAVYKLPLGIGNCTGKQLVRCMASAPLCTPGGPNANTSSTGLSPTAGYNEEYSGCNADIAYLFCGIGAARCQSQFVKELTVAAGETYAIAINNFTSTGNGFSMTFGGTAQVLGPVAIINDSDADDQICPGEAITFTDASTSPPAGSLVNWTWNFGVNATPATFIGQNPPSVTYSTLGVKTISLTIKSDRGCLVTSTKTITVANVPPTVSIVASQNPICIGTNVTFTATPTNAGASPTYQWYLNNNPVGTNSNIYTNNALSNGDQIKVQITSNFACNSGTQATSNTITMAITSALPVSVSISGIASVCQGASTTLTANPTNGGAGPTYQWFVNGNPVGTNSNTYSSSAFNNGDIVTVRLTSNLGCVSGNPATSANLPITVKPKPSVTVNSPFICYNEKASLIASGATSYTWTGGLAAISNPTTLPLTTTTTYTVIGTTSGCTDTAVSTVTVKPKPSVTVNNPFICYNETASLIASGATSYTWTGGLAAISNPTTLPLTTTTTYTVIGTTSGCTDTAVSTVTVKPKPSVTVNNPFICYNETASLIASGATSGTHGQVLGSYLQSDHITLNNYYDIYRHRHYKWMYRHSCITVTVNPNHQ
ncbi:MAG: PKD domain-containing protein [Chitinophagales bacterium]